MCLKESDIVSYAVKDEIDKKKLQLFENFYE